MDIKQLYALCSALMCDDHGPAARNQLVGLANEEAVSYGFSNWTDFYLETPVPYTQEEMNARVSS